MIELYNGPHLSIIHEKENSRLIMTWESSPISDETYRKELVEHLHVIQKIKPSQVIWLLENLTFKVSDVTKKWVDHNISKPIFTAGYIAKFQDDFDQVAFVVGRDVLSYISVMDIFNKDSSSGFKPNYFATEKEARIWLDEKVAIEGVKSENHNLDITFKGTSDDGKAIFEFREQSSKFNSTISLFKSILEQNYFLKNNISKYSSLTPREEQTLKFIVKGCSNREISDKMNISYNTVRTHRNRIWKKLDIKMFADCLKYEYFFD